MRDIDRNGVRERRHASTKVIRDPIDQLCHINELTLRLTTDSFESMRNAVKSLQVGTHVHRGRSCRRLVGLLLEQLDPSSETGERRAELMRRFAGHASPYTLARNIPPHANDIEADDEQDCRRRNLEHGNDA
jgi:hypothetical protein